MAPHLSVIVLTFNEENNLPACLASIGPLGANVFVVDSGSTDRTGQIAVAAGCHVVAHPFETYAAQRNWAFDNLPIETPWTLCLDADERLTPELAAEISQITSATDGVCDGYMLRKRTVFMGRWIRHGGQYPAYHLRLFRTGRGRCEDRLYDQHFVVDGTVGRLRHDYVDVITSDLGTFITRHNRWADLEARELLERRGTSPTGARVGPRLLGTPIERKRFLRMQVYRRCPLFVRPFLFWFYGYVLRLGFLDGVEGLIFHTLQRFWFRFLIDAKMWEMSRTMRPLYGTPWTQMTTRPRTPSSGTGVRTGRKLVEWSHQFALLVKHRSPLRAPDFSWLTGTIQEYDRYTRAFVGKPIQNCRVLEIGFGQRPYRLFALHAAGADVVGCDLDTPILRVRDLWRCLQMNGAERALKSGVRYLLFDLAEARHLQAFLGKLGDGSFQFPRARLVIADAADPMFWRNHPGPYDLAYSEDVFEHIPKEDVRTVLNLIAESLSEKGVALIRPMVWTGIQGGHHVEYYGYRNGLPAPQVPAWDHLRTGSLPANTYLNRLTRRKYRRLLDDIFDVLEEREVEPGLGRDLLTAELREELKEYDDYELLSNKVSFLVRRKQDRRAHPDGRC